tara:strand:+ start:423 stop:944 length:522 start_codon:yes stop_codon:yes gene_type:complete
MSILSNEQRLHLQNMMNENNIEDNTNNIMKTKHSNLIRTDVNHLKFIKNKYKELETENPEEFDNICVRECEFLFNNYTDIFNKIKKDIIDLNILDYFLKTLKKIEDGELDQNEGSYLVGVLLKKIYVDSALRREKKLDEKESSSNKKKKTVKEKNISYTEYKKLINNCNKEKN